MSRRDQAISRARGIMELIFGNSIIGVEVGVFGGTLSGTILEVYPSLRKLYGVDAYKVYPEYGWTQDRWDSLHNEVQKSMKETFGDRWELIRMESLEAVKFLPDDLNFVYLDGDHTYDCVRREIPVYEKKLCMGGVLCGHDYCGEDGVKRAVIHYAVTKRRKMNFNPKINMWWWYVE